MDFGGFVIGTLEREDRALEGTCGGVKCGYGCEGRGEERTVIYLTGWGLDGGGRSESGKSLEEKPGMGLGSLKKWRLG